MNWRPQKGCPYGKIQTNKQIKIQILNTTQTNMENILPSIEGSASLSFDSCSIVVSCRRWWHTSYLSFLLHRQYFWRPNFTHKKRLKTPKTLKMSLKKSNACSFFTQSGKIWWWWWWWWWWYYDDFDMQDRSLKQCWGDLSWDLSWNYDETRCQLSIIHTDS